MKPCLINFILNYCWGKFLCMSNNFGKVISNYHKPVNLFTAQLSCKHYFYCSLQRKGVFFVF